jgi:hypothetical protein
LVRRHNAVAEVRGADRYASRVRVNTFVARRTIRADQRVAPNRDIEEST